MRPIKQRVGVTCKFVRALDAVWPSATMTDVGKFNLPEPVGLAIAPYALPADHGDRTVAVDGMVYGDACYAQWRTNPGNLLLRFGRP